MAIDSLTGHHGRTLRVATALIGVLILGACSPSAPPPILLTVQTMEYQMAARVEGTVTLSPSGCYQLNGEPMVWPSGSSLSGQAVRLPDGRTVAVGDQLSGGGGFIAAADVWQLLDAGSQDQARTCLEPSTAEVAVMQSITAG